MIYPNLKTSAIRDGNSSAEFQQSKVCAKSQNIFFFIFKGLNPIYKAVLQVRNIRIKRLNPKNIIHCIRRPRNS